MRDPGDFDAQYRVLGPFSELFAAIAAVSRQVTSSAETAAEQPLGQLVAHSHSIVGVSDADGVQYLASVLLCFDADPADRDGKHVGTVLNLGPFENVRAATDAVSGEVAIGCYLMYERDHLAFTGISHSVVNQTDEGGGDQFFATAAVTYRGAGGLNGLTNEPPTASAAHHPAPTGRRLGFRLGGHKPPDGN